MLAWAAGFAGGMADRVANLIMAAPSVGWVDLSVINGEIVVKDGTLQTLDLQVLDLPHPCSGCHGCHLACMKLCCRCLPECLTKQLPRGLLGDTGGSEMTAIVCTE